MKTNVFFFRFRLLIFISLFLGVSTFLFAGKYSKWNDTLVYRPYKDTARLVKAQVYELNTSESILYYKPRPFEFVTNIPSDFVMFGKNTFARKNLPKLGLLIGATAVLVAFDQHILDASQQFGRYIHLDPQRKFETAISFDIGDFTIPVLDLPRNLNSTFYFLGEGWPSILVAGSFYGYGAFTDNYRALQTSSQLAEMFFSLAITCQAMKRITGRQSPHQATTPGGKWRPFTNLATYQSDVSNYDAFPSGHMTTLMATVTIIAGNYPSNKFIKPVGYTIMGLVGYSMLNNGVHWIGDYPVAIAIGYALGKIAVNRGQKIIHKNSLSASRYKSSLTPVSFGSNNYGLCYKLSF